MDSANKKLYLKSFLAGGVASMCAKTSVAPLDRMKILLQGQNKYYKDLGVFSGLKTIVKKEGFSGLYKGNNAQMVRIFPYGAVQFVSFEMYRMILRKSFGQSHFHNFLAGSTAGITAVAITYPLDVVRACLAFQIKGEHVYSGIFDAFSRIIKKEGGMMNLYKGFSPAVIAVIPKIGLSFYSFEKIKYLCLEYAPDVCGQYNSYGEQNLTVFAKLLCGGFAGAVAQIISYPLDTARRKMQLSNLSPHHYRKGLFTTIFLTYYQDGIARGLYRGMTINFLKIPMVAVSFTVYELLKEHFNVNKILHS
ncbi:graves disease carrier protein homolog [Caerostris darwini]|uniref:Graves disease carrier protein homolog n=1 Tax=Caerostris darwini TaxID=1538125 RepID=A0AAV4Q8W8_9ARAC|nr:graves disease carrier protein homolog [Caerostris darwini]